MINFFYYSVLYLSFFFTNFMHKFNYGEKIIMKKNYNKQFLRFFE